MNNTAISFVHVDAVQPEALGPGVNVRALFPTEHAISWIVDFAPGSTLPAVDVHATEERYFVVSGELIEGDVRHGPGTFVVQAPGSSHRPRTETGARILGFAIAE
ncbi:hypothetical protein GCM10009839_32520 [Catenulispora yoronensis]|uniref:ChrR-like cupin domain-containing protein n=1 Tax=Catenulispora yoronensis TaxID=450799 RepID=A0ABN2U5Y7_9ACTN